MRILVFSERLAPPPDEGIKKLAVSLAAALRDLGHDVLTLTTGGANWPDGTVADVPADRLLRSPALARRIADFGPQAVLYVPTASLTLASGLRARVLAGHARGAPVALVATQGRRHARLVRLAARLVRPDLCVVQARHTGAQALALGWRTVRVMPGVDLTTFRPVTPAVRRSLRARYGLPTEADVCVVLHAGHLNRRRGVGDLAALAGLATPVLAASTSTPHDPTLAAELAAAGVHVITTFVPHIEELYGAADVYLFPTPPDPTEPSSIDLPLSVLEAAACNLPILARRFGALPELWPDRPGVAFYDDPESLRAGLARLRAQPGATRPLAEVFSWQAAAKQMLAELLMGEVQ